jgi:hypothetical protein
MIYIKRLNVCFVAIPKTASSSMRNALMKNVVNWDEDNVLRENKIIHSNTKYIIENNLAPRNAKFIGVIREPFERQLSAYMFCWDWYSSQKIIEVPENPTPEHFKKMYTEESDNGIPYYWEFMGKTGGLSQASYINPVLNHEFWLYEDLEDHFEEFKKEYDITQSAKLEVINKSLRDPKVTTKSFIDKFYDDELKSIVQDIYANDFKLYNELKNARSAR